MEKVKKYTNINDENKLNQSLTPNDPQLAYSNFDVRHRIVSQVSYKIKNTQENIDNNEVKKEELTKDYYEIENSIDKNILKLNKDDLAKNIKLLRIIKR
mgnify:CR=1 FL=1